MQKGLSAARRTTILSSLLLLACASLGWSEDRGHGGRDRGRADGIGPTLALDAGMVTGSGDTGALLGGSLRFDLGERFAVELAGAHLDRGRQGGASGLASLLVDLTSRDAKAVPYLAVGGGVYHGKDRRIDFEDMWRRGQAGEWGPMNWTDLGEMRRFIEQMMGAGAGRGGRFPAFGDMGVRIEQMMGRRGDGGSSTDPALSLGGGIRIDLGHQLSLTPDARALIVFRDGDTFTLGTLRLSLGYRF